MRYPNFREEKKLRRKGYRYVVGLDEAGRGALCGPVVAAAVVINSKLKMQNAKLQFKMQNLKIKDSKKLSPKKREALYKLLIKNPNIEWGIGRVSEKVIDKINILEATKLAMIKAIKKLKRKPKFLIIDGNFKLNLPIPQKSIIKADEKVFSCAAASIIAKVYRDRIMRRYHKKYPQYGFDRHKGYPTWQHRKMLKKHGPCKIHRKTFRPVKSCKNKNYLLS
ncbi:MAG: ribonuclease HII [Candidatus Nealsonbacteria bacterium]